MIWIFAMAILAVPFFAYEGTVLQYNVRQLFGFDPISTAIILIAFGPFAYFVLKK